MRFTTALSMASRSKYPLASLPTPHPSHILTHNLQPDPEHVSVHDFQHLTLTERPSIQRRSRLIPPTAHFSYVSPLPIAFPYRIPDPSADSEGTDRKNVIETWLGTHEPSVERPLASPASSDTSPGLVQLKKYTSTSEERNQKRVLFALSKACIDDCVPSLDVGDAFDVIGPSALSSASSQERLLNTLEDGTTTPSQKEAARQELVDVLSGHSVLMTSPPGSGGYDASAPSYAPWSLRYCGHQFGSWAGQLGDGRAISILETPHPDKEGVSYEFQLKGAGRTPFSRSADGLAVLRSSVREFLGAEAMHALGVPTTRSLSLISLPDTPVLREQLETACVVTRIAPSFIRIGNFESHNPPAETIMYLFSSANSKRKEEDWEALRVLGEWVSKSVLNLDLEEGKPWAEELVKEVARRNALMIAGWQAYGFMHGVINTDNVSIAGLTIDYGPYAFMDVYDYHHICNHTDQEGRYAFKLQPTMIIFAIRALLRSLSPLIGAERALGHAVPPNWAENADKEQLDTWAEDGEAIASEVEKIIKDVFHDQYWLLMRKRLGLKIQDPSDEALVQSLLDILQTHKIDFHSTFRTLTEFQSSFLSSSSPEDSVLESFLAQLGQHVVNADDVRVQETLAKSWLPWLEKYAERIEKEESEWSAREGTWLDVREQAAREANPRFVLRQWVLEEVIKVLQTDVEKGKAVLGKVLEMSTYPFKPWGAEGVKSDEGLTEEEREERRLCGLGAKSMLGFQCSCSS